MSAWNRRISWGSERKQNDSPWRSYFSSYVHIFSNDNIIHSATHEICNSSCTQLTQFQASAAKVGKKPPQDSNSYSDGSQRKRGYDRVRSINFMGSSHFISKSSGRLDGWRLFESWICDTNFSAKVSFWSSRIAPKRMLKCDSRSEAGSYCLKWKNAPRESSGFSWAKWLGNAKVLRTCQDRKQVSRNVQIAAREAT